MMRSPASQKIRSSLVLPFVNPVQPFQHFQNERLADWNCKENFGHACPARQAAGIDQRTDSGSLQRAQLRLWVEITRQNFRKRPHSGATFAEIFH